MIELNQFETEVVSGAANVVVEYHHSEGPAIHYYDSMSITIPSDGSLPPEFQARIDSGASWDEIGPFLIMYSIIQNDHPELFQ